MQEYQEMMMLCVTVEQNLLPFSPRLPVQSLLFSLPSNTYSNPEDIQQLPCAFSDEEQQYVLLQYILECLQTEDYVQRPRYYTEPELIRDLSESRPDLPSLLLASVRLMRNCYEWVH